MAGRRTSLASLAGQRVEDVPGRSDAVLLTLPLDKLHCTRFNPRRNFGTDDELREFGEKLKKEQLQPAVVVSRAGYLKLWPDEADRVGTALYVIANGERRYRGSQLVGRGVLEVVHREDVAESRATFLDAVQSENNDRKDLDPIERAIAIETMVTELGGAEKVAVYYGKSKGWVSHQRKLLKLVPALQDLVSAGELPVRVARDIAGLPPEVQIEAWEGELEKRRVEKEASARLRSNMATASAPPSSSAAPSGEAAGFTAVNQQRPAAPPRPTEPATREVRFTAVNPSPADGQTPAEAATQREPAPAVPTVPSQTHAPAAAGQEEEPQPKRFPYNDPVKGVHLCHHNMTPEHFVRGAEVWLDILRRSHPDEYRALLARAEV
ncbi:hypothetical protein ACWDV7_20535 [Streptomyces sp. NPDC003362]